MKYLLFIILCVFKIHAQTVDFKIFLFTNKFSLLEVKYNAHSHTADVDAGYFYPPNNSYRAKLEMKAIVYDTTKAEHKKLIKNLKFKFHDTLLIYDWDPGFDPVPFNVSAAKFKYNSLDSALTFFNIQDISKNDKSNKPSIPERKFKVIKAEKDRFVLLDLDYRDVRRTYTLKKMIK